MRKEQHLPLAQDRTLVQLGQTKGHLPVLTFRPVLQQCHPMSHKASQGSKTTSLTCLKKQFGYRTEAGQEKKTQTKNKS